MPSDFERALDELLNEQKSVTRRTLADLSGATRAESDTFATRLSEASTERKQEIIAQMVEFAEDNFEMDYVALFRRSLTDPDPVVRRLAIEGLWEDDQPDLSETLLHLLHADPDISVRAAAATSLGRFVFLGECEEISERRALAIRQALERTIANPEEDVEVVRRAVESIAYINDDKVRRIIDQAYASDQQLMRESAVFAMGRSADLIWADTVLAELDAPSPAMRYEAVRASGELQLRRAVSKLIDLTQDPDREVAGMAIWSLGQIGGKRARAVLERLSQSDDEMFRVEALDALDELDFGVRPMDLLVHELGEEDLDQVELLAEDDEGVADDEDEDDDDDWEDEPLTLN